MTRQWRTCCQSRTSANVTNAISGIGAQPGSGQSGNPLEENSNQKAMVSEVNWSHDQSLLAAAIGDYVAIFDLKKLLRPLEGQM